MARYEMQLRIVKRFKHASGRAVYAYHDSRDGSWFVEERDPPEQGGRRRWYDLTEEQAAHVCFWLMGDGTGWRDES
jgi:hypothetical protein